MSLFSLSTTLALGAAFLLPLAGISAADAAVAAPILNTVCLMDGKDVDAKAPTILLTVGEGAEAKSFRLAMCSHACCTSFQKDPAAALKPVFGKMTPGPKTNFK